MRETGEVLVEDGPHSFSVEEATELEAGDEGGRSRLLERYYQVNLESLLAPRHNYAAHIANTLLKDTFSV